MASSKTGGGGGRQPSSLTQAEAYSRWAAANNRYMRLVRQSWSVTPTASDAEVARIMRRIDRAQAAAERYRRPEFVLSN